ncbi:hypothetical protein GCM10017556_02130 [Micromonospora sagamiensis]|nr:hypothetical protein GCM10017556_02130 [Micromonospora sagamiensis]
MPGARKGPAVGPGWLTTPTPVFWTACVLGVAAVVGAVEREVAHSGELGLDPVGGEKRPAHTP